MRTVLISDRALDPAALSQQLRDPACGALVTFEGWVRNHHEGRAVRALSYEVYEPLAVKEGLRILDETAQRFPVEHLLCVHRSGDLAIGDVAVWVGVTSHHRDEAFRACRHVIDEVKVRLPIWKKEHYVDGESAWVNCERCAEHAHHR